MEPVSIIYTRQLSTKTVKFEDDTFPSYLTVLFQYLLVCETVAISLVVRLMLTAATVLLCSKYLT